MTAALCVLLGGALENAPVQVQQLPAAQAQGVLSIARGDALLIQAPQSAQGVQARRARLSAPAGLTLSPWVELGSGQVLYALRVAPKAALGRKKLNATIELLDAQGRTTATLPVSALPSAMDQPPSAADSPLNRQGRHAR